MKSKSYNLKSKIDNINGFYEWNQPLYAINNKDHRSQEFKEQKEKYGFSDDETWSLDMSITLFVLPRLKQFRRNIKRMKTYPMCFKNTKEWLKIIDKMILAFELIFKEDFKGKKITQEEQNKINEGLFLFGKYFQDLWW